MLDLHTGTFRHPLSLRPADELFLFKRRAPELFSERLDS